MQRELRQWLTWRRRICIAMLPCALLLLCTVMAIDSPVKRFHALRSSQDALAIHDRAGVPLNISYRNSWSDADYRALHQLPEWLPKAFILSEDKRFYDHHGVDWLARARALWQRMMDSGRTRGASSITEQLVRMQHPRPRTIWSKWLEGWEAIWLESQIDKASILERYLNQVPYASNRRGVQQAARFYFNRDVSTLSPKEMLALVVLVRAPSRFDLYRGEVAIDGAITRLAQLLADKGILDAATVAQITRDRLTLESGELSVNAFHFMRYLRRHAQQLNGCDQTAIRTTLDSTLQRRVEALLLSRLQQLSSRRVGQAAVLVVERQNRAVRAWVSVGAQCDQTGDEADACQIDFVTVPRQPGSAMKPFLYAMALEKGWTAATTIEDLPDAQTIGTGIHHFHNYSRSHYGAVTLRQALGNSLNIPALHTIRFVGAVNYLERLHRLGFDSLNESPEFYDDGLALGTGEVTLLELVRGYTALANQGMYSPLHVADCAVMGEPATQPYSPEVASLIGNILSDPWARELEFGHQSVLNLPAQTATKTGTSTDYRDAWAVGYDHRYVVGIWMGNANQLPMDEVTGSTGPALLLRSIFSHLNQQGETRPLYLSTKLVRKPVCLDPQMRDHADKDCPRYTEYFLPSFTNPNVIAPDKADETIAILRPSVGLRMAMDPRVPGERQQFEMRVKGTRPGDVIDWRVDGNRVATTDEPVFYWPMQKGEHHLQVDVHRKDVPVYRSKRHPFVVR